MIAIRIFSTDVVFFAENLVMILVYETNCKCVIIYFAKRILFGITTTDILYHS